MNPALQPSWRQAFLAVSWSRWLHAADRYGCFIAQTGPLTLPTAHTADALLDFTWSSDAHGSANSDGLCPVLFPIFHERPMSHAGHCSCPNTAGVRLCGIAIFDER